MAARAICKSAKSHLSILYAAFALYRSKQTNEKGEKEGNILEKTKERGKKIIKSINLLQYRLKKKKKSIPYSTEVLLSNVPLLVPL